MKNMFKAFLFMIVLVLSAAFVSAGPDPVLSAISDQTINEGQAMRISLASTANDTIDITAGGAGSTFRVCQVTSPSGSCPGNANSINVGTTIANISSLSNKAGEFNWTPDFTQAGTYYFNISVADSDSTSNRTLKVTVVDVPPRLGGTGALALGNAAQQKTNPLHDTETARGQNATGSITLSNEGPAPETITSITVKMVPQAGFTESDLKVNFSLPKTALAPGESMTIPVIVRIPEKLDAVSLKLLNPEPVSVGTLEFSAVSATSGAAVKAVTAITLQTDNHLDVIDNVKFTYGGKTKSASNDELVKDVRAGQAVDIEVTVKNTFTERENIDIQDVTVRVTSGTLDIDEEDDLGDISPQDKETVKFTTTIDEDADDNTYDVEVTADGKDEFGARHGERIVIRFEIKRKSHEIEIKGIIVNPPTVACEKEARLTTSIRNSGKNNEKSVVVRVASPDLGFGAMSDPIELDENDEDTASFAVPVPESLPRPANYRITVETYYDTSVKSNSDVALLSVQKCAPAAVQEEEEQLPVKEEKLPVTVITVPPLAQPTNVTPPQQQEKKSLLESPAYLAILGLGYVVVLGGGAALLIKLMRKP